MNEKVLEIVSKIAKKPVSEIQEKMDATKLWDSLLHVELIIALETEFNVFFSQEEIVQMDTPTKVIEQVSQKV